MKLCKRIQKHSTHHHHVFFFFFKINQINWSDEITHSWTLNICPITYFCLFLVCKIVMSFKHTLGCCPIVQKNKQWLSMRWSFEWMIYNVLQYLSTRSHLQQLHLLQQLKNSNDNWLFEISSILKLIQAASFRCQEHLTSSTHCWINWRLVNNSWNWYARLRDLLIIRSMIICWWR